MEDAVAQVKHILRGTTVTDAQVRDAVWNYYFDVDRSVKFLRDQLKRQESKRTNTAKKPAVPKAFRERSLFADTVSCRRGTGHDCNEDLRLSARLSPSSKSQPKIHLGSSCQYGISVFDGIPWGLPASMNTDITYCGRPTRMGLLGGSSKLAALAKARAVKRQQQSEQPQEQSEPMEGIQHASSSTPSTASQSRSSLVLDTSVLPSPSESGVSISKRLTSLLAERSRDRGRTSARAISPEKQFYLRRTGSGSPSISSHSPINSDLSSASAVFSENIPSSFATSLCDFSLPPSTFPSPASPSSFPGASNGDVYGNGMSADEIWKLITNKPFFYLPVTETQVEEIKANFDRPSPDDIIKEAQATKGGTTIAASSKKQPQRAGLETEMKSLSIQEPAVKASQPKQKINVVEKFISSHRKAHVNFVVVGHVDAGKSTLMGRLLYDVGAIDERTIQKYKRDANNMGKGSFAFAWVLDQSKEERERGVTMDVAMNSFESSKVAFTILDAPGHKDFVPNMIAGASEADFAVLVIDSSPNAFEAGFVQSGQTKEHALLVRSLGVQRIIVAVNKVDNVNWSEFRFDEVKEILLAFLSAAGFSESQTTFIPCSGLCGDNIVNRSGRAELSWYKGNTLLEELENLTTVERDIGAPLRMSVTDVFKGNASSAVNITGRINAGNIQVGETVLAIPSNETATIKSITIADQPNDWAVAGDNVQVALSNIDIVHLRAGDILCAISSPVKCAQTFSARVIVFQLRIPLIKGSNILIYRGRTTEAARILRLTALLDKSTGKVTKHKPRHLVSGQSAIVELEVMGSSFPMETFKASKDLGRVVLRQEGITVAAGIVEEILSVKNETMNE
ncbi:hypothetical protein V1525DRAFT_395308 [Lipomyces kononenkoae]|uniref:Uncharacterized protein n=1 Tax=Lipomyces kononenkoae TaxID=34357 RepID=A0ACC3T9F9_LIPKO